LESEEEIIKEKLLTTNQLEVLPIEEKERFLLKTFHQN